jgi:peptide/nickel transport system substrate-binding protein
VFSEERRFRDQETFLIPSADFQTILSGGETVKRNLYILTSLVVLASLTLTACGGGTAPATQLPAITEPPATGAPATEAPATEAPATESPAATEAPAANAGTAIITFVQQPTTLSPLYASQWFATITSQFFLKSLWSFDPDNNPIPEIAAEIPTTENGGMSEDGKTLTVKLRDDVTWSDGEPVTANDFVFTYDMYMADANTVASRYPYEDYVDSVEAPDDTTVVVHFKEPFAAWLTSIFAGGVLPEHVLKPVFDSDGTLDNAEWNTAPTVGVGPFVFKEWETDSHLTFEANPNWINPPKLQQIFIRMADDAAQEVSIIAGDTDIGTFLDWSQADAINNSGKAKFVTQPSGYDEGWYLNFDPNTANPAMLDVNVRKAIVLATDREKILKDLLGGLTTVPATYWASTPPFEDPSIKPLAYDPEEAKRLLDEAGWKDSNGDGTRDKDGKELVLRYIANQRQLRKDVQAVVQQMWAQVGIGSELVNYGDDYFNGYADGGPQATGKYDIAEYSDIASYPDPDASKFLCTEVVGPDHPDGANWQGYCNEDLDKLFDQQATETDPEARKQIFYQIEKIMDDEVVWVGLWKDPDLWSVNNRLQNVKLSGATPFWNAHEWTISE